MSDNNINRRNFLLKMGIGGTALGVALSTPKVIAKTANGFLVESEEEYGGFYVEKFNKGQFPYEYDNKKLLSMREKYTMFSRNMWDPERKDRPSDNLMMEHLVNGNGTNPNQTRLDWACMAAAWSLANARNSPCYQWTSQNGQVRMMTSRLDKWDPASLEMSWEDASLAVKHAALFYGGSLAGIAELNPLWLYSNHYSPERDDMERAIPVLDEDDRFEKTEDVWYIPKSMNRVISIAFEEDYDAICNSPGRIASAAVGNGYSRMAFTSFCLAEFIRGLGYRAIPAGNGVGLSIPIAIDAGFGELGRNGLLITPKFGPRVRLAKVITDMPLIADSPINFGVKEFCDSCMLCAEDCPSGSIPKEAQTWEGTSASNNPGSLKWYIHPESCYDYNGFSCSNCKRNCPFNKPNNSWLHKIVRQGIKARVGLLDKVMVSFDQASGYGQQVDTANFWEKDGNNSITARYPE